MTFHIVVFLLSVCLLLSLARLGRLRWFPLRPSSSRGRAKRSRLHRLRHRPAAQTMAQPADSPPLPRRLEGQHLLRCAAFARSQAGGEHPSESTPRGTPVPTNSACPSGIPMLTSTPSSGMASMARPSASRRSEALPAAPPSLPGAPLPCTV
jgi:hypothetical protein